MKAIWKFPLEILDLQEIAIPKGAIVRAIQVQDGRPCLWAEVDSEAPKITHEFRTYGTGHPMDTDWPFYLGTYQVGALVFHVYTKLIW